MTSMTDSLKAWHLTGLDPWASHLPLLRTCGWATNVLELGMGRYSTPTFLDRAVYPFLERLVSIESNPDWMRASDDPRHEVHAYPEPIEALLDTMDLDTFDLIFVDNSDKAESRIATLKYVCARRPHKAKVLIHDWERYHDAVTGFRFGILDDRQMPQTALVWG